MITTMVIPTPIPALEPVERPLDVGWDVGVVVADVLIDDWDDVLCGVVVVGGEVEGVADVRRSDA
jgi:hypothetical protein